MKKFQFPLDRVLDWRRIQGQVEEAKLEQLHREARVFEERARALTDGCANSERETVGAASTTGLELAALEHFRNFAKTQHQRIEQQRVECASRISAQSQVLTAKRREIKLLEKVREQQLSRWTADFDREIDAQADEAFLAKFATNLSGLK